MRYKSHQRKIVKTDYKINKCLCNGSRHFACECPTRNLLDEVHDKGVDKHQIEEEIYESLVMLGMI